MATVAQPEIRMLVLLMPEVVMGEFGGNRGTANVHLSGGTITVNQIPGTSQNSTGVRVDANGGDGGGRVFVRVVARGVTGALRITL